MFNTKPITSSAFAVSPGLPTALLRRKTYKCPAQLKLSANLCPICNTCAQQGLAEAVKSGETIQALWGCMDEDELKSFRDEECVISQVDIVNAPSTDDPIE